MSRRDLAYKKELLTLKGEMLRLRLRHDLDQARGPLTLVSTVGQMLATGGKARLLTAAIPNQRLRNIVRTALRAVLVWQTARKYWSQR